MEAALFTDNPNPAVDEKVQDIHPVIKPSCHEVPEHFDRRLPMQVANVDLTNRSAATKSPLYHLYTIWLFTFSDIKTIIAPKTAFGILSSLAGPVLTTNSSPNTWIILSHIPKVAFWVWINLLPFAIDNQRQPKAVDEDGENKPWRAMPSRRISPTHAKYLMFALYPSAFVASLYLGGLKQCVLLMALGYWYNDLEGADQSCIIRNLINALGFVCYASGATEIAAGHLEILLNVNAYQWLCIVGAVVFTTVHMQDMYDQVGDSLRGRWTVPLSMGDWPARWTIAIPVAFWSFFCPAFWQLSIVGYLIPVLTGTTIIYRVLSERSVKSDKITFRIWNLWMVFLYLLPLIKRISMTAEL